MRPSRWLCLVVGPALIVAGCHKKGIDTNPASTGNSTGSPTGAPAESHSSANPGLPYGGLDRPRIGPVERFGAENLKRIGKAFLDTETADRRLMPAILDPTGKPLLSWRVAILPHLHDDKLFELYGQFKLNEPWDSDANKKLLGRMPVVFVLPGTNPTGETKTLYRTLVGTGAFFDVQPGRWQGTRFKDVIDGTANTLLLVEAAEPVPWTKPDELLIEPDKPLPQFGFFFDPYCLVMTANGTVHKLRKSVPEQTLRLLINPRDGTPIDHGKVFMD
jgi:hypothetical protein